MSESPQDQAQEAARPEGPGRRLRDRREALGLSVDDVAHDLRLHPKLVRALEENDAEQLPPPAFVLGYLRNYARLVELPEQEIVEAYERAGANEPELVSYGRDTQVRSSDLPVRLVTYILVIGLVGLLVMWWLSEGQQTDSPVEQPPEAQLVPGEEEPLGDAGLETPVEPATPGTEPAQTAESGAQTETETATDAQTQAPAEEEPAAGAQAQSPEEPVAPSVETPGVELRMIFTADSWVNISDASGRELAQGLIKQGRELTLDGRPPYRVFLGYAPGVTIYYRGEQFDHAAFVRGNETARFRVGSADDIEAR